MKKLPISLFVLLPSLLLLGFSCQPADPVPTAVNYNSIAKNTNGSAENAEINADGAENSNTNTPANSNVNIAVDIQVEIPDELNLAVPFTSQAPTGNWDALHEEACEEASSMMAARFILDRSITNSADAEAGIQELTSYVADTMHLPVDITGAETAQLINEFYGLHAEVKTDFTWNDVKQALAQGYPVIIPAAGQQLGNPYYTAPGPLYHMLVVKGYTAKKIITNDSGTKRGADYQYTYDTVMNAAHDWNSGDVTHGQKVAIIVKP